MYLKSVCWDITPKCNENCLFCYREKKIKENSFEDNKIIIRKLLENNVGKISFLGGEPLLYQDLFKLVDYAKCLNKKTKFSITTNATLLVYQLDNGEYVVNHDLLNKVIEYFDWITFPLDAPIQSIQSEMGRNDNHLRIVLLLLEELRNNNNIKIKINTVVSKINYNYIFELCDLLHCYNITRWKLFYFLPSRGNALENQLKLNITEKDYLNLINKIKEKSSIKITSNCYSDFIDTYVTINAAGSVSLYDGKNYNTFLNLLTCNFDDIFKYINLDKHVLKRSDYLLLGETIVNE